jgi:hypothetical protein
VDYTWCSSHSACPRFGQACAFSGGASGCPGTDRTEVILVVRDAAGKVYTVRYEAVNAMLLNAFLKEHQKVEKLEAVLKTVIHHLKEVDSRIEKVNAQLELSKPTPKTALNTQ